MDYNASVIIIVRQVLQVWCRFKICRVVCTILIMWSGGKTRIREG